MFNIKNLIATSVRNKLIVTTVLVAMLAVLIVGGYAIYVSVNQIRIQTEKEETVKIAAISQGILNYLAGLEQDVVYLSQSQALAQYLNSKASGVSQIETNQKLRALEKDFLAFSQASKGIYDQIRFLDADGQEIVRVNSDADGNSVVVPQEQLQNKAGRYYFDDTIKLPEGRIFISPLDLNVEKGQVEVLPDGSYKPVIRYGTPVVFGGRVVGVIVTNVLAEKFLQPLGDVAGLVYLTDSEGYYLYHPDETKRWGRDLDTDIKIQNDYV